MTLRISLRDGEKVVINGAVIRASGRTDLAIESKVTILRGREIMSPAEASTPARALSGPPLRWQVCTDFAGVSRTIG